MSDTTQAEKKIPPLRRCFCCGEELGRYWDFDRYDTCGKLECQREMRDAMEQDREEAHEQLDRDMGYW